MASCNVTPIIPAASRRARAYFFLNTGTPGVRFLQYDEPTEQTFFELFESVGFITDCRDTAKKNEQGFVVCAKDIDSINRDSTPDANGFTKSVLPHQLPNVYAKEDGCGIEVVDVINTRDCCDGTAKDFEITNIMVVDDNGNLDINGSPNPIEVTQPGPGCDTNVFFNPVEVHNANGVQTEPGKVIVCADDTESQYISDIFTTNTPCTVDITVPDSDSDGKCEVNVDVNPFLCDEIRMYGGDQSKLDSCFPGGVGKGQYEGWFICDGNNGTMNMGDGRYMAGYDANLTGYDINGMEGGTGEILLQPDMVPLRDHDHVTVNSGTITANSTGSEHRHRIVTVKNGASGPTSDKDCGRLDRGSFKHASSREWYTGWKIANGCSPSAFQEDGGHNHSINYGGFLVTVQNTEMPATEPIPLEPRYKAIAYIQYKGTTLCDCRCGE